MIGVVTSPTGAVIRDIMHRLNARFPRRVLLWPVAVQGDNAAAEITAAITGFNAMTGKFPEPDLIIVARGGGSVEDLMAFNDEAVVRAVAASLIPLISAVGHETDTTLIDFVSDMRAPTPTAAAELAVPLRAELLAQTLDYQRRMLGCFSKGVAGAAQAISTQLARILPGRNNCSRCRASASTCWRKPGQIPAPQCAGTSHPLSTRPKPCCDLDMLDDRISLGRERAKALDERMYRAETAQISTARKHLEMLSRVLGTVSYTNVLERGFALVRGEDGKVRRRAAAVKAGEALTLTFADGEAPATAGAASRASRRVRQKTPPGQEVLF